MIPAIDHPVHSNVRIFLLFALIATSVLGAAPENSSSKVQRVSLSQPDVPTLEEQQKIVDLFAKHEPRFTQLGSAFPHTALRIFRETYPPEDAGRVRIDADITFGDEYFVSLWFSVRYDKDLTKIADSRIVVFQAIDLRERIAEGQVGKRTVTFTLDEMDEFCREPWGLIREKFKRFDGK